MKRSVRNKTTPNVETLSVFPSRCDPISATELLVGFSLISVNYLEKLSPRRGFRKCLCCESHTVTVDPGSNPDHDKLGVEIGKVKCLLGGGGTRRTCKDGTKPYVMYIYL